MSKLNNYPIRESRMMSDCKDLVDVVDSLHISPGTRIKLHYLQRIGNSPYIEMTRTVTVVREYPTWLLVDFGKYYGTVSKIDVMIDEQRISL